MYTYTSIPAPLDLPPLQPIYLGGYPACTTASFPADHVYMPSCDYLPSSDYQPRPQITLPSVLPVPVSIPTSSQYHSSIKQEHILPSYTSYPNIILPPQTPQLSPALSSPSTVFHYPTPPTTPTALPTEDPTLLFARCLLQNRRYTEFQQFVSTTNFLEKDAQEMRDLWWDSVYQNHMFKTQKKLTPMIRYRLRKRHPLPKTIWNGEQTSYNLKQSARDYLIRYYEQNQYPTATERRIIARDTGMEFKSVSHWFKNRRSRNKAGKSDETVSSVDELVNEVTQIAGEILYS